MTDSSEGKSRQCDCGCDEAPQFRWDDGLRLTGIYCTGYARGRLPQEDDVPSYGTAAGVVPFGSDSTIKTIEQLEDWL